MLTVPNVLGRVFGLPFAQSILTFAARLSPNALLIVNTALAATEKQKLYQAVWWSSFWTWLIISIIGGVIAAVIAVAIEGCSVQYVAVIAGVLFGLIGGYINSGVRATHAYTDAWDQKVILRATHIEKLLGVWVRYDEIPHTCVYADTDSDEGPVAATGCKNVTRDSYCASEDSDGDCIDTDYRWYPWFTLEYSRTADLNTYESGHMVFSDYSAPPDWQNYLMGNDSWLFPDNNIPDDAVPGVSFIYEVPSEWLRIKTALDQRPPQLLPGVVYHNYLNWVHADPETVFRGSTYLVPQYQALGLLPTINPITDNNGTPYVTDIYGNTSGPLGYDFKIIQFLGSCQPSPEVQQQMQQQALLWASAAGPKLKTNLMLNFACADEVPNRDQWMSVTKAFLMDASVHGRNILPMNLSLINCGLPRDMSEVSWCNMETGLFEGNVELKMDIARLAPFPFTPEALFGTLTGGFVLDPSGNPVMEDPDWDDRAVALDVVDISFVGGALNDVIYGSTGHKFEKVSMDRYANKQYIIPLNAEEIQAIKNEEFSATLKLIVTIWGTILVGGAYGVSKMKDS